MPPQPSTISAPALSKSAAHEAAVIDVGSNSVRLVIYRVDGRALTPTHNEKVTAALGKRLLRTGRLSPEGAEKALKALVRFREVIDDLGIGETYAVATAAVREAEDGPAFAERVKRETGITLRVLTGGDEARLSALGVLAGAPDAAGVVGDLGGSSLELVEVHKGNVGRGETFRLGHLALGDGGFDYERVAAAADAALAESETTEQPGRDLYAVGGAWRALARIHMKQINHPLRVLHHHEMSRVEALKITDLVRRQSKRSLATLEDAAAKRADSLPFAAVVLERLLVRGKFERVILSSYGLREGVLLERMTPEALAQHPLIAGAEAFAEGFGGGARARAFGQALERWIAPAFAGQAPVFSEDHDAHLRGAAARLADVGGALHPDQRSEIMFDLVLRAPLAAINHVERAFLAACVHHRYTKSAPALNDAYSRLLHEDARRAAMAVGAALRLGADASARSQVLLAHFTLRLDGGALVLSLKRSEADLLSDQAVRRLEALGTALGLPTRTALV